MQPRQNTSSRQSMILKYYPLVRKIALKMSRNYPDSVQADDIIQIGVLGLIDAIDRYRPSLSSSFISYARIRIQGAILDDRRQQDWVPRSVRDRASHIQKAQARLEEKLNRKPSNEELAGYLHLSLDRLNRMLANSEIRKVLSLEHGAEESKCLGDIIPSQAPGPQELLISKERKGEIRSKLQTLSERERKIIRLHYYKDCTFNQIGKEIGVSEARISQIHSAIATKMNYRLAPYETDRVLPRAS